MNDVEVLERAVSFLDKCCSGEVRLCPSPIDYRYKNCRETELRIYRRWRRETVFWLRCARKMDTNEEDA